MKSAMRMGWLAEGHRVCTGSAGRMGPC